MWTNDTDWADPELTASIKPTLATLTELTMSRRLQPSQPWADGSRPSRLRDNPSWRWILWVIVGECFGKESSLSTVVYILRRGRADMERREGYSGGHFCACSGTKSSWGDPRGGWADSSVIYCYYCKEPSPMKYQCPFWPGKQQMVHNFLPL